MNNKSYIWVVQEWKKVSKDATINSFDVCGITTKNVEKISCTQNLISDRHTETIHADINDIIDDDDVDV